MLYVEYYLMLHQHIEWMNSRSACFKILFLYYKHITHAKCEQPNINVLKFYLAIYFFFGCRTSFKLCARPWMQWGQFKFHSMFGDELGSYCDWRTLLIWDSFGVQKITPTIRFVHLIELIEQAKHHNNWTWIAIWLRNVCSSIRQTFRVKASLRLGPQYFIYFTS